MKQYIFLLVSMFSFLNSSLYSITQEELHEYAINQNDSALLDAVFKYAGSQKQPSLNLAMQEKDYFAVFLFIEYGVEINSRFESIGEYLTHNLLRIGAGKTVLELAIGLDEVALVDYFLLNKADPTSTRQFYEVVQGSSFKTNYITTAVYDAILHDRLDIMTLFVQYGADLNKMCYERQDYKSSKPNLIQTPLQAAIAHGRKDIVALLLSAGIEL